MTIYVKVVENGSFTGGFAHGKCEYFDTSNCTILKGQFVRSKLMGDNNIRIEYTDTTFKAYMGQFVNNQPDGNIMVYEFNGNGDLLHEIIGTITVDKINCIYASGTLSSVISSQSISCTINVVYKQLASSEYINVFDIVEV